jgi:hypothetical protein
MNLSRRQSLGLLAGAVIPPTVVVGAAPLVAAATKMTAQERYNHHLAEFQKAAKELDPMIEHWHISGIADDGMGCAIVISAHRITGRYYGDGIYEGGKPGWDDKRVRYHVKLMDYRIDDEPVYHVSRPMERPMDRMLLTETRFNTFIGRKVGALS